MSMPVKRPPVPAVREHSQCKKLNVMNDLGRQTNRLNDSEMATALKAAHRYRLKQPRR